ncbi:MAG: DNA polymerase Y family protein [Alphaproteobacteria bacterium]|nr:DNA polymerase Y family protein [Alphaproteobacteria bacterium]
MAPGFPMTAKSSPAATTRRIVSLWLPNLAIDRLRRAPSPEAVAGTGKPVQATVVKEQSALRLAAVDSTLLADGVLPGMPLTDVRAIVPDIRVAPADPAADRRALIRLADWCTRYTPWVALDAGMTVGEVDGLWLDVTGCAHLVGGERPLVADLVVRLRRLGFAAHAAIADTPGVAWAMARFATSADPPVALVPAGGGRSALAGLPVAALRLPMTMVEGLERLGLRRAGDLFDLPRGPLVTRFGETLVERVDQALGRLAEPLSPRELPAAYRAVMAFAEPIGRAEDLAEATRRLLADLCTQLEDGLHGARRLVLTCFRVDGELIRRAIGTSRPARDPVHLFRLFEDHLASIAPGFGLDAMALAASVSEPLATAQLALDGRNRRPLPTAVDGDLAQLVDRLSNRLGPNGVVRLVPRDSYLPERACFAVPALVAGAAGGPERNWQAGQAWFVNRPRPLSLLSRPEPIEVIAPVPDEPPVLFRWRRVLHHVRHADGPERMAPEWWRLHEQSPLPDAEQTRDYFSVEDMAGARFWLYRNGLFEPSATVPPRWFLHGLFA